MSSTTAENPDDLSPEEFQTRLNLLREWICPSNGFDKLEAAQEDLENQVAAPLVGRWNHNTALFRTYPFLCQNKTRTRRTGDVLRESIYYILGQFPHRVLVTQEQAPPEGKHVAEKDKKPFYRYRCYRDLAALVSSVSHAATNNLIDELYLYALAERSRPIYLFMDLEIENKYIDKQIHCDGDAARLFSDSVRCARSLIECLYNVSLDRWDGGAVAMYQSHSAAKISAHVHAAVPFADIEELELAMRKTCLKWLFDWHALLDLPFARRFFYRKTADDTLPWCFIDQRVYTPERMFRMAFNTKRGRNAFLQPLPVEGITHGGPSITVPWVRTPESSPSNDAYMRSCITDTLLLVSHSISMWNRATFTTLPPDEPVVYGQHRLEPHIRTLPRLSTLNTRTVSETDRTILAEQLRAAAESENVTFRSIVQRCILSRHTDLFRTPDDMLSEDEGIDREWTRLVDSIAAASQDSFQRAGALISFCSLLYGYVQDPTNMVTTPAISALADMVDYWAQTNSFVHCFANLVALRLSNRPTILLGGFTSLKDIVDALHTSNKRQETIRNEVLKVLTSSARLAPLLVSIRSYDNSVSQTAEPRQWIRLVDLVVLVHRVTLQDENSGGDDDRWERVLHESYQAWRQLESSMTCWTCELGPKGKDRACPVHSGYITSFDRADWIAYPQRDAPCDVQSVFPEWED